MAKPKIIVFVWLLLGCNFSKTPKEPKEFNSKVSELFFNADINATYDKQVRYFKTVGALQEFESGWTIYPPLSALHQENDNIDQTSFEFDTYLNISSELKSGFLNIRKVSPTKKSLAVQEITLDFKLPKHA